MNKSLAILLGATALTISPAPAEILAGWYDFESNDSETPDVAATGFATSTIKSNY